MKSINSYGHSLLLEVDMQVVFGSPSRNCAGSGLCKMLPIDQRFIGNNQCKLWRAKLRHQHNGDLLLIFPFQLLSELDRKQWRNKKAFFVEEKFDLPPWVCKALQCDLLSILPHHYQLELDSNVTIITFVKEKQLAKYPDKIMLQLN